MIFILVITKGHNIVRCVRNCVFVLSTPSNDALHFCQLLVKIS